MRVFLRGADLYRVETAKQATMERYGRGTPDDWIERNLYTRHSTLDIMIMLVIDVLAFGLLGLTVWAVQMAWIPFWAAGVVNGLGHFMGYRNFSSPDASTNLFPLGLVIGGEELHNNHHAHATSTKFFGAMLKKTALRELKSVEQGGAHRWRHGVLRRLLLRHEGMLSAAQRSQLETAMQGMKQLQFLVGMRRNLAQIWDSSMESSEQLLLRLRRWLEQARASRDADLAQFAADLSRLGTR